MAFLRTVFGAELAAIAGFAAVGAALGLAGPLSPTLDIFAHFAPFYVLLALLIAVSGGLARLPWWRTTLALSAVGLVGGALLIIPEFLRPDGPYAPPEAPGQIKVIQFNARRSNADIRPVADWLIAQDADVVTVSEARHDLRDLLLARTGWKTAGAHGDLIIFTRQPYIRMNRPQMPGGGVSFVNASYASPSGPFEAMTTHLAWPTEPVLRLQLRGVEDVVRQLPRRRMILTGDFNATPWSAEVRRLDRLGLTRRDRAIATYPAQLLGRPWPLPFLPIDHIYAGRGWATVKVERGPWLGSDHYPLIVTLAPVERR